MQAETGNDDQNRHLLQSLYREILGRDADEGGLLAYGKLLSQHNRDHGISTVVRSLSSSMEFTRLHNTLVRVARHSLCRNGFRTINGLQVRHIASLGTHCLASYILKRYELKTYSLPFDWLFSSPKAVLHCLGDRFETLLDASHYISVTERRASKEPGADHAFYLKEFGVSHMFAHRDPSTPDDFKYFERAAERFKRLTETSDAKLFVIISRPEHDLQASFHEVSEKLRALTENCFLIGIQLLDPTLQDGVRSVRKLQATEMGELYEFEPSSTENGAGFAQAADEVAIMQLIWQYSIDLSASLQ